MTLGEHLQAVYSIQIGSENAVLEIEDLGLRGPLAGLRGSRAVLGHSQWEPHHIRHRRASAGV